MRTTRILAWSEEWRKLYCEEQEILKRIFKDHVVDIVHIGSTSIPTIGYAKPIIDILLVVNDIGIVDDYNEEMMALGYEPKGENGIVGRRYFPKGKENRTHHLHIFQEGNCHIKTHIDFKNYLIKNPTEAQKYGELKLNLAKQFPNDHYQYQVGKQQFTNEIVRKAKEWALRK